MTLGFALALTVIIDPSSFTTPRGVRLVEVSPTFLEALLGVVTTVVGFLIIALVFAYEQQRRAWLAAFRINDANRRQIVRFARLVTGLIMISIVTGLRALAGESSGGDLLPPVLPAISVTTAFAALLAGIATVAQTYRLLSSASLAARISRPGSDPTSSAQILLELALAEHRAENDGEFRERVGSIKTFGNKVEGTHRQVAVEALLDLFLKIEGDRNRMQAALTAVKSLLPSADEEALPPGLASKARDRLQQHLQTQQPSASLTEDLLEIGWRLCHTEDARRTLLVAALEQSLGRRRPSDIWPRVREFVRAQLQDHPVVAMDATAEILRTRDWSTPGKSDVTWSPLDDLSEALIADLVEGELLQGIRSAPKGEDEEFDKAYRELLRELLRLRFAGVPAGAPTSSTQVPRNGLALLHEYAESIAEAPRPSGLLPSSEEVPQPYLALLAVRLELLCLPEGDSRFSRTESQQHAAAGGRILDVRVDDVPFIVSEAMDRKAGSGAVDFAQLGRAASALRLMLYGKAELRGTLALPAFQTLRLMSRAVADGRRNSVAVDLGVVEDHFVEESAQAGFFSSGLVDCSETARDWATRALSRTMDVLNAAEDLEESPALDVLLTYSLLLTFGLGRHLADDSPSAALRMLSLAHRSLSGSLDIWHPRESPAIQQIHADARFLIEVLLDALASESEGTHDHLEVGNIIATVQLFERVSSLDVGDEDPEDDSEPQAFRMLEDLDDHLAQHLLQQVGRLKDGARDFVPWDRFPRSAFRKAAALLNNPRDNRLPSGSGAPMPLSWDRRLVVSLSAQSLSDAVEDAGVQEFILVLGRKTLDPKPFAEVVTHLADVLIARTKDADGVREFLESQITPDSTAARWPISTQLRGYFLEPGRYAKRSEKLRMFVESHVRNKTSVHQVLGLVECSYHYRQASDPGSTDDDWIEFLQGLSPGLVPIGLGVLARRGKIEPPEGARSTSVTDIAAIARNLEKRKPSRRLVLGLDCVPDDARIAALHLAIAQLEDDDGRRITAIESARKRIADLQDRRWRSLRGDLEASADAVLAANGTRTKAP